MAVKCIRRVDDQGRVIIPVNVRNMLNLEPGTDVEVDVIDGAIKLIPVLERCEICGESVEGKHHAKITVGDDAKRICYKCSQKIMKHIMR